MVDWPRLLHESAVKYLAYSETWGISQEWTGSYSMHELPQYQSRFYSLLTLDSLGLQAEETISYRPQTEKPIVGEGYLSTRNLANSLWMFFNIFFTSAAGVPSTNKLCMVLESRRVCFASMRITLTGCK